MPFLTQDGPEAFENETDGMSGLPDFLSSKTRHLDFSSAPSFSTQNKLLDSYEKDEKARSKICIFVVSFSS